MNLRSVLMSATAMPFFHALAFAADDGEPILLPPIEVTASPLGQTADQTAIPVLTLSGTSWRADEHPPWGARWPASLVSASIISAAVPVVP